MGAWNFGEARKDFQKCLDIDLTTEKVVSKMLEELRHKEISKDNEDRAKLRGRGIFANS